MKIVKILINRLKALFLLTLILVIPNNALAVDFNQYPALVDLVNVLTKKDGFPRDELVTILESANIDEKTLALMDKQYESLPWYKYRKIFLNEERIKKGVEFWNTYQSILDRAHTELGVPPEIIVAVIGVETHYGTRIGSKRVLDSLVTLSAAYPRRSSFFSSELRTFLNITRKEGIAPGSVVGSFAGAIGIPQFMPTSYEAYSVDFNGNNKRDLVNETADAIGSVANYLKAHGWNREQGVYANVIERLSEANLRLVVKKAKPIYAKQELINAGIVFDSANSSSKVTLLSIAEENAARYFVGFKNFYAITRYNPSVNYAMAVSELSEALSELKEKSI